MAGYDLEFLRDLYDEDCPAGLSSFDVAAAEFRKFAELFIVQDDPLAVTDRSVDRLWHTFVIHTEDYREFCEQVVGDAIEHRPHSDRRPVPSIAVANTFERYEQRFGPIPDSWLPHPSLSRTAIDQRALPRELPFRWSGWPGRRSSL